MSKILIYCTFIVLCFIAQPLALSLSLTNMNTNAENSSNYKPINENFKINSYQNTSNPDLILQSFYWAVPNGTWYNTVASRLQDIANLGFTILWMPPPSKTYGPGPDSNGLQMGYEPYDYYDLGQYNQQGSVNTRFGSKSDLLNLINRTNNLNMSAMADIVLNHNRGGYPQPNGLNFTVVKSGLFLRNATDFNCGDGLTEYDFPDLCTTNSYVRQQILEWGQWLRNKIGFKAWRFDFVKGYNASTVKAWTDLIGGFSLVENWQSTVPLITQYLSLESNTTKAFDFPLMYTFLNIFGRNGNYNLSTLINPSTSLLMTDPQNAVTFVDTHDTVRQPANDIIIHRDFMYAFILLYAGGTPSVFWRDLYPNDPCAADAGSACQNQLDINYKTVQINLRKLLEIRKDYASGTGSLLYSDQDLFIYQRNGNPGLILALNDNPTKTHTVTISTKYSNTLLYELMDFGKALQANDKGQVTIQVPPLSYLVYSQVQHPTGDIITSVLSISSSTSKTTGNPFIDTLAGLLLSFIVINLVNMRRHKKY